MAAHYPELDRGALDRLRTLVAKMHAGQGVRVPIHELVSVATEARVPAGVTVDFQASRELGHPMIVLRVPSNPALNHKAMALLSGREHEVARLIAQGLVNKQIAAEMGITTATVKDHVHSIISKTGLSNRAAIAAAVGSA